MDTAGSAGMAKDGENRAGPALFFFALDYLPTRKTSRAAYVRPDRLPSSAISQLPSIENVVVA